MADMNYLDYHGLSKFKELLDETYAPYEALQFKGTVATISALPTVANAKPGWMYNVTTGGQTTADFVEGSAWALQDGENVVAINTGTEADPVMKWDILGGVFDLNNKLTFGSTMPASPDSGDTFLYMGNTTYSYTPVTPTGDEDPSAEGWYEYDSASDEYNLSEDTSVDAGTTYFTRQEQYVKGVIYVYSGSAWVAQSSGNTYIPITDAMIEALF